MCLSNCFGFPPVSIIPQKFHTHLHLHAVHTRTTYGQNLGQFKKHFSFRNQGTLNRKVLSNFLCFKLYCHQTMSYMQFCWYSTVYCHQTMSYMQFCWYSTVYLVFFSSFSPFNLSNTDLNSACHLLALLGAQHILHISRVRVKMN
jgi:hypothetical protein